MLLIKKRWRRKEHSESEWRDHRYTGRERMKRKRVIIFFFQPTTLIHSPGMDNAIKIFHTMVCRRFDREDETTAEKSEYMYERERGGGDIWEGLM